MGGSGTGGRRGAFSRRLVFSLLGMLALFAATFAGTLLWLAREHDALAADNARVMIDAAIDVRTDTLAEFAVDYAYWDAAVEGVGARDAEWIAENMVVFSDAAAFDLFVIVYPDGAGLGWTVDGGKVPRQGLLPMPLRDRLVAAQRAAEARPHPTTADAAMVEGEVWHLATANIAPHTRPATEVELDAAPVAIFGRRLTPEATAAMGETAFVEGVALATGAPEDAALDALPVRDALGAAVAHVTWPRPAPGSAILTRLALPIGLIFVGLVAVGFAIGRHVMRSARHLEDALSGALSADRAKSEFLTTISHELRTPMNGVIGVAQLLETTPLDEDQAELVEILRVSAEGQMALIEELLAFGEIEAGALRLSEDVVDLPALLDEATGAARVAAQAKGVALGLSAPPQGARPIATDAKRLRQVIVNLAGNAVKFAEEGSVEVTAALEPRGDGEARLRVGVSDTGPGIARDQHARIFERFTQVDGSVSRRGGGTGLGLAISRAIAREMGGDIALRSAPGEGSTFTLSVPVRVLRGGGRPRGAAGGRRMSAMDGSAGNGSAGGGAPAARVLVVDDEPLNVFVLRRLLRHCGLGCEVAGNGAEAVEMAVATRCDVILMDISMPVMDGVSAAREIAARLGPDGPCVIAVTANATAEQRRLCDEAGFAGFIPKPVRLEALQAALEGIAAAG